MSDHSRGQALASATVLSTNGNNTQTIVIPEFSGAAPGVTENVWNLRRKAGWPSHRSSGGIFHRPGSVHTPRNALDRQDEDSACASL